MDDRTVGFNTTQVALDAAVFDDFEEIEAPDQKPDIFQEEEQSVKGEEPKTCNQRAAGEWEDMVVDAISEDEDEVVVLSFRLPVRPRQTVLERQTTRAQQENARELACPSLDALSHEKHEPLEGVDSGTETQSDGFVLVHTPCSSFCELEDGSSEKKCICSNENGKGAVARPLASTAQEQEEGRVRGQSRTREWNEEDATTWSSAPGVHEQSNAVEREAHFPTGTVPSCSHEQQGTVEREALPHKKHIGQHRTGQALYPLIQEQQEAFERVTAAKSQAANRITAWADLLSPHLFQGHVVIQPQLQALLNAHTVDQNPSPDRLVIWVSEKTYSDRTAVDPTTQSANNSAPAARKVKLGIAVVYRTCDEDSDWTEKKFHIADQRENTDIKFQPIAQGLQVALELVEQRSEPTPVTLVSNNRQALQAIRRWSARAPIPRQLDSNPSVVRLIGASHRLRERNVGLKLQWVPVRAEVLGNLKASCVATCAARMADCHG